jgi:PPOX class probable F420-dependent enzyme
MASEERLAAFLAEPRNVIVIGVRKDGRPHATPTWFHWDGELFYVSTTRTRAKYAIFSHDPRAELVVDDPEGFRCVLIPARVDVREDAAAELDHFRAINEKHGFPVRSDEEFLAKQLAEQRVLLAITPDAPPGSWTAWGLD